MHWPDDADGDVLRRLQDAGFNFSREVEIDFNIDFEDWPPSHEFTEGLKLACPGAKIVFEEDHIQLRLRAPVTYEYVVHMQTDLTEIARPFGGWCESWGVLWDPKTHAN
ncbi:MAG: ribonuclease E inhibitor RraB [Pseudomonadota bacterium]